MTAACGWHAPCGGANDASAASGRPEGRTDGENGTDNLIGGGETQNTGGKTRNGGGERGKVRRIRRQNGRAGGRTKDGGGGMQDTGGRTGNTGGGMQNAGGKRENVPRIEGGNGERNIERTNIITIIIMRRAAGLRQHVRRLLASACSTKSAQSAKLEERSRSSASDRRLRLARALRAAERRGRHARWSERRKQGK